LTFTESLTFIKDKTQKLLRAPSYFFWKGMGHPLHPN